MATIHDDPAEEGVRPSIAAGVKRRFSESIWLKLCLGCALVSVLVTLAILFLLFGEASHFFRQVSIVDFLTGTEWSATVRPFKYGVLPLVIGTLKITLIAIIIALPIGLASAIYLNEYASVRVRAVLKPMLEILAGIPTVVYGYFGIVYVTPFLKANGIAVQQFNALSGAIVVAIMILPLITSLSEDSLRAIPVAFREGAYGLGATKSEVIMKVVIPGAISGIAASVILAISRAVGETMAVTMAAGMRPTANFSLTEPIQTMTSYIVQISQGETAAGTTTYYSLFAVGAVLFIVTLGMNILSQSIVRRLSRHYSA